MHKSYRDDDAIALRKLLRILDNSPTTDEDFTDILAYSTYGSSCNILYHVVAEKLGPDNYKIPTPQTFPASDWSTIGMVPPGTRCGDLVVQFWKSSASVIVRPDADGFLGFVGRAGFIKLDDRGEREEKGEALGFHRDVPLDQEGFQDPEKGVDLVMDLMMLIRLGWNTGFFPEM